MALPAGGDLGAAQQAYDAHFGPDTVVVERSAGPIVHFASRLDDAPGWNAGDFILDERTTGASPCTSGFGVRSNNSSATYLLSASHCYDVGHRVNNDWPITGRQREFIGTVDYDARAQGYDAVLIRASVSGLAWRTQGATDTVGRGDVVSANGAVLGQPACVSGAPSGERCGSTINGVNIDGRMGGLQNLIRITHNDVTSTARGQVIAGPGDSGGPVYSVQSNGLNALGTVVGIDGGWANMRCHRLADFGNRAYECSDRVYAQDIASLLVTFQASIL